MLLAVSLKGVCLGGRERYHAPREAGGVPEETVGKGCSQGTALPHDAWQEEEAQRLREGVGLAEGGQEKARGKPALISPVL